jgi:NADH dehydrogenase/NADH:ubiquinone oxidoreductase subunit G
LAASFLRLQVSVVMRLADRCQVKRIEEAIRVALVGFDVVDDRCRLDLALGQAERAARLGAELSGAKATPPG